MKLYFILLTFFHLVVQTVSAAFTIVDPSSYEKHGLAFTDEKIHIDFRHKWPVSYKKSDVYNSQKLQETIIPNIKEAFEEEIQNEELTLRQLFIVAHWLIYKIRKLNRTWLKSSAQEWRDLLDKPYYKNFSWKQVLTDITQLQDVNLVEMKVLPSFLKSIRDGDEEYPVLIERLFLVVEQLAQKAEELEAFSSGTEFEQK